MNDEGTCPGPHPMFANIPTALTWLRILLIPVFVAVYYLPDAWLGPAAKNWTAMTVFAVARDGLARRLARRVAGARPARSARFSIRSPTS